MLKEGLKVVCQWKSAQLDMCKIVLTSINFDVDLVLAGAEQDRLVAVCEIVVSCGR